MALGKIVETVLTKYEANTSGQVKGVKKLQKVEKTRGDALVKDTEKQNSSLGGHIAKWGAVAGAVAAVSGAVKLLSVGFDALETNTRLRAATTGVSIEGLRKATFGLVDDTRLLELASKGMNGEFALSQKEMEGALRGAVALRKTAGIELPVALDKMAKAVNEGSTEPFKKLIGVMAGGAGAGTDKGLQGALDILEKQAAAVGGEFNLTGDSVTQAGVDLENAADSIRESIGEIAIALTPAIKGFASFVSGAHAAAKASSDWLSGNETRSAEIQAKSNLAAANAQLRFQEKALTGNLGFFEDLISGGVAGDDGLERAISNAKGAQAQYNKIVAEGNKERLDAALSSFDSTLAKKRAIEEDDKSKSDKIRGRGRGGSVDFSGSVIPEIDAQRNIQDAELNRIIESSGAINSNRVETGELLGDQNADGSIDRALEQITAARESFALLDSQVAQMKVDDRQNLLGAIFGTPAEINATAEALSMATDAIGGMSVAFRSGVSAMITGSKSFKEAVTDSIGQTLHAMSVEMSVNAFKHAAFAVASLAFGSVAGAATHAKAAAMFGAGALVAGASAKQFSVNKATQTPVPPVDADAGAGAAGAGAAGVGRATPGGPANGNTTIVMLDDDFLSLGPRQRESMLRSRVRNAGVDITGDVVVNG